MSDQDLGYALLIELLAYQFASPVRWTDTQDTLFSQKNIQRLIEIGPKDTLTSLAKRTVRSKYQSLETQAANVRQLLGCKSDRDAIYYNAQTQVDSKGEIAVPTIGNTLPQPEQEKSFASVAIPEKEDTKTVSENIKEKSSITERCTVSDSPVTALEIIETIVSCKLNKKRPDFAKSSSIKNLSGGQSIFENELIGDLLSEFGHIPHRAEELSLEELAAGIQPSFDGKLGDVCLSLISKMAATKLPRDFGLGACRNYLEQRRLGHGNLNRVLLGAVLSPPPSRLRDEQESKQFLDAIAKDRIAGGGIPDAIMVDDLEQQFLPKMDPEVAKALQEKQENLSQKLLEVYADTLGIDLHSSHFDNVKMRKDLESMQDELDQWMREHGQAYATGIQPAMVPEKVRVYDSSWNWTLMDVLVTYYELETDRFSGGQTDLERISENIANRSEPTLLNTICYLQTNVSPSQDKAAFFLQDLLSKCQASWTKEPVFRSNSMSFTAPRTVIASDGSISVSEVSREGIECFEDYVKSMCEVKPAASQEEETPLLYVKSKQKGSWCFDSETTATYHGELQAASAGQRSFSGMSALLIGAGTGSIGSEVLMGLLRGGAKVVVTTSSYNSATSKYFQALYARSGARNAKLLLVPFNQGSLQDVEKLLAWIHDTKHGLGWDLDFVLPFAAIGEDGRDIGSIDSKSELAHRIMLTNTIRLIGGIKRFKEAASPYCRTAHVILPLSPNHGLLGNDGLYSESKMGLESLLARCVSESWGQYVSICGAVIGWTRSTGLMQGNDIVADGMEALGLRTFSQEEMAFNILSLMTARVVEACQDKPLLADLSGRFGATDNLKHTMLQLRRHILNQSQLMHNIRKEDDLEKALSEQTQDTYADQNKDCRGYLDLHLDFPELKDHSAETRNVQHSLVDMVDLDRVAVVTGFAELGPYGNSRTRWQMESTGHFTEQGWVEMAWLMGLIRHYNGPLASSSHIYCGWVDAVSAAPVYESEIERKYGKHILEHTGIRILQPAPESGYDPHKKQVCQQIILEENLPAFTASREQALQFEREHGSYVQITEMQDNQFSVKLKRGATLFVPKALDVSSDVGALIPTGWDPKTYGIAEDLISQVDPVVLFTLVCTVEALLSSGITDPYELYNHVHMSDVGNCIGSGFGGATSLEKMYKGRFKDETVGNNVLQETFINTVNAWINMLLLSATGPIRTPVGACATSLESLDTAHDLITSGKARVCVVGGVDDFSRDTAYEFGKMSATVNTKEEYQRGRTPKEMSRPATSTRSGFVESHGCGIQVVMSAKLAVDMGVPIYGVVAFTATASDKIGRSVPAPGKGVVCSARERRDEHQPSPLMDFNFRRRALRRRQQQVENIRLTELQELETEAQAVAAAAERDNTDFNRAEFIQYRTQCIEDEAIKRKKDYLFNIGNHFWRDNPAISPIRGALAVWGLTVDDIRVASLHGTSTVMNEKNEFEILQRQMEYLGRAKGNRLFAVLQKHLTGHPKGAAGAWMLNGCLQIMQSGLVPGNSNTDNIDEALKEFDYIAVPGNHSIQTDDIAACSVTSFGFGQKGTQAVVLHPRYVFAALTPQQFDTYRYEVARRRKIADQVFENGLVGNNLVRVKTKEPFDGGEEALRAMLDPTTRLR